MSDEMKRIVAENVLLRAALEQAKEILKRHRSGDQVQFGIGEALNVIREALAGLREADAVGEKEGAK